MKDGRPWEEHNPPEITFNDLCYIQNVKKHTFKEVIWSFWEIVIDVFHLFRFFGKLLNRFVDKEKLALIAALIDVFINHQ